MIIRQVLTKPSIECISIIVVGPKDWRDDVKALIKKQDKGEVVNPVEVKKIT